MFALLIYCKLKALYLQSWDCPAKLPVEKDEFPFSRSPFFLIRKMIKNGGNQLSLWKLGTTVLWYLANQISVCCVPNCNSCKHSNMPIVCTVACSRGRQIKSGSSGGQKWTYPIPVIDRHLLVSFPLWSIAGLQFLLPHSPHFCPVPSSTSCVGRAAYATVCSTWAETQGRSGASHGRKIMEPVDSLPWSSCCLTLYLVYYPHSEKLESLCLLPSLSAALQLSDYPNTASSSPILPIALCLPAPRNLWVSTYIANFSYYRVSFQMTGKYVRFVTQEMSLF